MIRWLYRGPLALLAGVLILAVRGYQWCVRPLLPPTCRFDPG